MGKLKIGMIGCGGIAMAKHLPALKKNEDLCEVIAFSDNNRDRAEAAAKKYGTADAAVYQDYRQLLENKAVDVAYVLTPNVTHSQVTIAAFEAGKHVMCEKAHGA